MENKRMLFGDLKKIFLSWEGDSDSQKYLPWNIIENYRDVSGSQQLLKIPSISPKWGAFICNVFKQQHFPLPSDEPYKKGHTFQKKGSFEKI